MPSNLPNLKLRSLLLPILSNELRDVTMKLFCRAVDTNEDFSYKRVRSAVHNLKTTLSKAFIYINKEKLLEVLPKWFEFWNLKMQFEKVLIKPYKLVSYISTHKGYIFVYLKMTKFVQKKKFFPFCS